MKYKVILSSGLPVTRATPLDAVLTAARDIHIGEDKCLSMIDDLEKGETVRAGYGFCTIEIYPVAA
jgi:hypothetical protein